MVRNRGQRASQPAAAGIPTQTLPSGTRYYVCPSPKGAIRSPSQSLAVVKPCTIISSIDGHVCLNDIERIIDDFLKIDDVYSQDFASNIIIQTLGRPASKKRIPTRFGDRLGLDIKPQLEYSKEDSLEDLLPPGPYFVHGNAIHEAWRLYPDYLDAFQITFMPQTSGFKGKNEKPLESATTDDHIRCAVSPNMLIVLKDRPLMLRFSPLDMVSLDGMWRYVAVPSRLYATPSDRSPLAGLRISVKDNFKIRGIKTTMTNRSFTELYTTEPETAEYVVRLIELGAIIVGKSKMCSFAAGEDPTDQWIDFHCPFNPRGDSYQSPGGSSSGAAASLAGYPWLDYSIGTDSESALIVPM